MIAVGGRANLAAPPRIAFNNLVAGYTTPTFTLPAGMGELQFFPADPNNPGTVTLTDPNSNTFTLTSGVGAIPGMYGSLYFQTLGGGFTVATTAAAQSIVIYFADQVDSE